ncbi:MAG: alpha/beta hydrolase [Acetobacteraceae bacterium]
MSATSILPASEFGFAVDLVNRLAPRRGVRHAEAAYGPGARGGIDLYRPADARRAPTILFFYGGGWEDGARAMYRFVGAALAARGVACAIPDYRLFPEVRFPAFMEDAAAALAWLAARPWVDRARLLVMGHSAGAQIATLLALDPRYRRAAGAPVPAGVIGLAGPYDFLPLRTPVLQRIFGPAETWPDSQPVRFVHPDAPPMLLAAGARDRTVLPRNTRSLEAALRRVGAPVRARIYPGLGHRALIGGFAEGLAPLLPVRRAVLGFIREFA